MKWTVKVAAPLIEQYAELAVYRNSFRLPPGSRKSTALRFDLYDLRGRLMRPESLRMRKTAKFANRGPKSTVCESFHLSD
jgi:hypothetical protein